MGLVGWQRRSGFDPLMTHQERIAALQAQGLHSILAQFCDIHGVAKGKLVPVGNLGEWVEQGAGFSGPSIWGTGLPRMGPRSEYYGRIQPDSLRALPYMPGVAHAVCDGFAGGQPLDTCSRQVLKAAVARLDARGWKLWVGIEPEFFLLKSRRDGGRTVAARRRGRRSGQTLVRHPRHSAQPGFFGSHAQHAGGAGF